VDAVGVQQSGQFRPGLGHRAGLLEPAGTQQRSKIGYGPVGEVDASGFADPGGDVRVRVSGRR
jgi:hypothetical protein